MERRMALGMVMLSMMMAAAAGQTLLMCTVSMIASFTPCVNYLTGSSNSMLVPTAECCDAFVGVIRSSTNCACLLLTGSIPFSLPINRTLALSLPSYCNSTSVDLLKCQGSISTPAPVAALPPAVPPPTPPTTTLLTPQAPPFVIPSSAFAAAGAVSTTLFAAAGALLLVVL